MTLMKSVRAVVIGLMLLIAPAPAIAGQQPPPQEEFVPVDQLPGEEELPAVPLVAAAYGIAWVAVLLYLFSIWRRLGKVEREMAEVAKRIEAAGRR